jgi:hypothetical protein
MNEYENYIQGRIQSSRSEPEFLHEAIYDILERLLKLDYKEIVKDYITIDSDNLNIIKGVNISQTINLFTNEKVKHSYKSETPL